MNEIINESCRVFIKRYKKDRDSRVKTLIHSELSKKSRFDLVKHFCQHASESIFEKRQKQTNKANKNKRK